MNIRISLLLICFFFIAGCLTPPPWVEPRPLGNQYYSFLALEESPETVQMLTEPTGEITLQEALTLALLKNPSLRIYSWEVRKAEARAIQAGLMPNPEFSVETENFGGSGDRAGFRNAETTLSLSQVIELGFKGTKRRRIAEIGTKLKAWDYESKRLDIFTETTQAFIEYTASLQKIKLSAELLKLAASTVKTVQKRHKAGKDSEADVKKAEVAYSLERIHVERDKRELEIKKRTLAMLWSSKNPRFNSTSGDLEKLVDIATFDELQKKIDKNPEIARWATEAKQRKAQLNIEWTKVIPDLELGGGIKRHEDEDDYSFVMGLSIALPILDWNEGNIRDAELNLKQLTEEKLEARNRIWLSLANTWEELALNYFEIINLKDRIIPSAKSAYSEILDRFQKGRSDYLDVLDAQRTFFETRREYIESLEIFHLKVAETERLIAQKIMYVEKKTSEEENIAKQ